MSSTGNAADTFHSLGRQDLDNALKSASRDSLGWIEPGQLPVVYSDGYNIRFYGVEKLHPFDSCKYEKVIRSLQAAKLLTKQQLVQPKPASEEVLADVHTPKYLEDMRTSKMKIAAVTELAPLVLLPLGVLQSRLVGPMKHHVGGTMLAASLAITQGWAINVGGGMHHAYFEDGAGWCPFDDIVLAIRHIRRATEGKVQRVLVIDLDAHQGNGVERDKLHFEDENLFILDVYNARAWPGDTLAKTAITIDVGLNPKTKDEEYLSRLDAALGEAAALKPQLVIFNAGTDPLAGDPLGGLSVSPQGIVQRDERVWQFALDNKVPIVQVLSGGYARNSAEVISQSLKNLMTKFKLGANPAA